MNHLLKKNLLWCVGLMAWTLASASAWDAQKIVWSKESGVYYTLTNNQIITKHSLVDTDTDSTLIDITKDSVWIGSNIHSIESFELSADEKKILVFCNAQKKWRHKTKGTYIVLDRNETKLYLLGASLSEPLLFAQFSPDATKVAYVCKQNIYVENIANQTITQLTHSDKETLIHGTFDWVYEEEFSCRDGFRWSADGRWIAFWQIDASAVPTFSIINNTDSAYSTLQTMAYPKVNKPIPKAKIGVVDIYSKAITWVSFAGFEEDFYLPRMDWFPKTNKLIIQYLNRTQNKSKLYVYNVSYKKKDLLWVEKDSVWIETKSQWHHDDMKGWEWVDSMGGFLWMSEKDGWRHIWMIDKDGKERLVTKEPFDVIDLVYIDKRTFEVYYLASPMNATQRYLYKQSLKNPELGAELLSPDIYKGTNAYNMSTDGLYALHVFTNHFTPPIKSFIKVASHEIVLEEKNTFAHIDSCRKNRLHHTTKLMTIPYPQYNTYLDLWIRYPDSFRAEKKYPVLFYVYGEPASQVVVW